MLMSHKVIDTLMGLKRAKEPLCRVPGVTPEMRYRSAALINRAEKFDFGPLMLEGMAKPGHWELPTLTPDEQAFFRDGLIPLPFPVCWYEWVLGGTRSGFLVTQVGTVWEVARIDIAQDGVLFDGVTVKVDTVKIAAANSIILNNASVAGDTWDMEAGGNLELLHKMKASGTYMQANIAASMPLVVYLTLMLSSRSTEFEPVKAPPFLNSKRVSKGLTKLADHRIVHIVPHRFRYESTGVGGERRSPRLHWRRSHLRHLSSGKVMVIARMLVGKAELGEVSHEYHIHTEGGNHVPSQGHRVA